MNGIEAAEAKSRLIALACGLAVMASGGAAWAASFDCARASSVREQMVCADPDLSKRDGEIGQLYRGALARLSPAGATRLRQGERQWLTFLDAACLSSGAPGRGERRSCLQNAYGDRIEDLKLAAVRKGPYLFTRVDLYTAAPAPPEVVATGDHRVSVSHIAYPQIDQPDTAIVRQWNALAKQVGVDPICGPPQDVEVSYQLGLATRRLISVSRGTWAYCYGMAHGNGVGEVWNVVLTPGLRPLRPADLFRQGAPWKTKLTAFVRADLADQDPDPTHLDVRAVAAAAASPRRWFLKSDGLEIDFDAYELGEGYPFQPSTKASWSALRDVLAANPNF